MAARKRKKAAGKKLARSPSIQSAEKNVDRLVSILEWLGSQRSPVSMTQLAEATGLSYATAYRWVRALQHRELVSRTLESAPSRVAGSGYKLEPRFKFTRAGS